MSDPFARKIAAVSLCASLLALVLAAYAVWQGAEYRDDVRALGQALITARPTA